MTASNARTVLLVDDEPDFVEAARQVLEADGWRVIAATDPERALLAARGEDVSLALLDVNMPGMDGFDLCRELRRTAAGADLPVVFLTVRRDLRDMLYGIASGARDYLTKPVGRDDLLRAARRAIAA